MTGSEKTLLVNLYYNAIAPPPNGIVVVLTTWHIAVVDVYVFEHAMILKQTSLCATYLGKKSFHGYLFIHSHCKCMSKFLNINKLCMLKV